MKALRVIQYALMMALVMHIMSSCDPCDDEVVIPPPPIFEFTVVDAQGNSLISADSSFYRLSSVRGETEAQVNADSEGNWLMVYFDEIEVDEPYYIELVLSETDTMTFVYGTFEGDCYSYDEFVSLSFNGEKFDKEDRVTIIR